MHHYCTSTFETISLGARPGSTQLIEVPRLALTHQFLLDTVFALTCLHLAYLNPLEAQAHIADSVRYHSRALNLYRQRLENLQPAECKALFHTSAKLGIISLAMRAVDAETAATLRPTEALGEVASLWRGSKIVLLATQELMDSNTYEMMFPAPEWDTRRDANFDENGLRFLKFLRQTVESGELPNVYLSVSTPGTTTTTTTTEGMDEYDEKPNVNGESSTATSVYLEAIDELQDIFQVVRLEKSRILAWLSFIPPLFQNYLQQQQPMAMAIVLLYSVFIRDFKDYWWAGNFQEQLLNEVVPVVSVFGPEFAEMAEWAKTCTRSVQAVGI